MEHVTVVRNGAIWQVWLGSQMLSTHTTNKAARIAARQIVEANDG